MNQPNNEKDLIDQSFMDKSIARRKFFSWAAGTTAIGALILQASCKKDDNDTPAAPNEVNLGQDDLGIMNYLYAVEQVITYFFQKATSAMTDKMLGHEKEMWNDIRAHQEIHSAFYKNQLGSTAIPDLSFEMGGINFTDRNTIYTQAKTFTNWGVHAYNGAAALLDERSNLNLMLKIASVKARHATWISNMIAIDSYSSGIDVDGLDSSKSPSEVLNFIDQFVQNALNGSNLPK